MRLQATGAQSARSANATRHCCQPLSRLVQRRTGDHDRRASLCLPHASAEIGMQRHDTAAIAERRTLPGVEEAFRRQSFGQQNVVPVKLDMEVVDGGAAKLHDRGIVDQVFDGDEGTFGQHGVVG